MGWLSFISNKFKQKGDEVMSENVVTPEESVVEAVVPDVAAELVTAESIIAEPTEAMSPVLDAPIPEATPEIPPPCGCGEGSCTFTAQLQVLEDDIATLEADLLKKLAQKKSILLGENAKVDLDISVLGTLK